MGDYKLSRFAEDDLRRIYFFGLEQFGEAQADAYFFGLHQRFQEIADHPLMYPETDVREGYRRSVYRADAIYFRIKDGFVEIMAILGHQKRDL